MNGNNWFLLIVGLVFAAILSFAAMRRMSAPLPKYVSQINKGSMSGIEEKAAKTEKKKNPEILERAEKVDYDVLWQKSLFNDVRSEGENGTAGGAETAAGRPMANSEFEVVGLIRIGKKDGAVPVAIISQVKGGGRNAANAGDRRGGRMFPRRQENRQSEPAMADDKENRKVDRNLYRVGDTIGNTGYTVKNIIMEENKVIVVRTGNELELVLDVANTNSSVRRENVQRDALQVRDRYAAQ